MLPSGFLPSTLNTDPSASPLITDLTDGAHIQYIRGFQAQFDAYRATPAAAKHGAQIKWVIKNVMGAFQQKFGAVSPELLLVCMLRYFHQIIANFLAEGRPLSQKSQHFSEPEDLSPCGRTPVRRPR